MGKKDGSALTHQSSALNSNSKRVASRLFGEIEDFQETIKMKIDRIERSFDRLATLGTGAKSKLERKRIVASIQKDIDRVNVDISECEMKDLKKLSGNKEKAAEFADKLLKYKVKINKQNAKF